MAKLSEDVIKNQLGMHHDIDESISFEEIDKFGDRESMLETVKSVAAYKKQLEQRITFINQDMTNLIPFTRENLYLMCAYS
jgi:hypothetical protein